MNKKKVVLLSIAAFLILDGFLLTKILNTTSGNGGEKNYPETGEIQDNEFSFKEASNYFTDLAEDKGAAYAYEILKRADMPEGIDMHLMGHIVGDILYKQEGANGMSVCTPDFRNACSHSIVVGMLLEYGEGAMPEIADTCRAAPGGSGAYTMCFHGLGHGILAYTDYNLEKAIDLCKVTGTEAARQREYVECVGGTIMEIIGGGFHNPDLWKIQTEKYLSNDDPLSPCNKGFVPDLVRPQCYAYLTPHLFEAAGASLAGPTPEAFEKAFPYCDAIPTSDPASRATCYGGFGKEFVVLAKARDIRDISSMTSEEMNRVYNWCLYAKTDEGISQCINSAVASLFWGGENDRGTAIKFCDIIDSPGHQATCFDSLMTAVQYYIRDTEYRRGFCGELPGEAGVKCRKLLL